ncbi:MAG: M20/M25/M40 family metallo-hydrolase [Sinimarinibacterium sp.]|jgi:hypothetical protein
MNTCAKGARILLIGASMAVSAACVTVPNSAGGTRDAQIDAVLQQVSAPRIESSVRSLAGFGTRHTLSDTTNDSRGIGAARRWIKAEFERASAASGGRLRVEEDAFVQPPGPRNPQAVELVNVVATLPGVQPEARERIYVVSGHYDSRASDVMDADRDAPGANDDASGVAAVLELARVMSQFEWEATLVFMAVAGEEQGLLGARHWAQRARAQNLNIAGMITNDIIGSSRAEDGAVHDREVRLFAEGVPPDAPLTDELVARLKTGGENDSPARELGRFIVDAAGAQLPDMRVTLIYRRDRFLRGGDHTPFLQAGYAAVRLTEPNEDFRHQHQDVRSEGGVQFGDLPVFCDFEYVARVTRVNAAALGSLALAPAQPSGVRVDTGALTNATTLYWDANREPDLAGYEVVWRDTTSPTWQHTAPAGPATQITLPVSKDNVIFGVRAVDRDGHRSPAVYPTPGVLARDGR